MREFLTHYGATWKQRPSWIKENFRGVGEGEHPSQALRNSVAVVLSVSDEHGTPPPRGRCRGIPSSTKEGSIFRERPDSGLRCTRKVCPVASALSRACAVVDNRVSNKRIGAGDPADPHVALSRGRRVLFEE